MAFRRRRKSARRRARSRRRSYSKTKALRIGYRM